MNNNESPVYSTGGGEQARGRISQAQVANQPGGKRGVKAVILACCVTIYAATL